MALNSRSVWALLFLFVAAARAALTVSSTILVLADDPGIANVTASGLRGYGIPYQTAVITSTTQALPALNKSATLGNFGAIIIYDDSILGTAQYNTIYAYQTAFKVRLVVLNASPATQYGTKDAVAAAGCCDSAEQLVSITNSTGFPTAGLNLGAGVSTLNLWHVPATITNSSMAWQVASFAPSGAFTTASTAAVINSIGTREQMVWFLPFEQDWSEGSTFLQHAWIHWMTRGLYAGYRRLQLNTQVDDVHLTTAIYYPANSLFRLRPADLDITKTWVSSINSRMNAGSNYIPELGHNGNGNIITSNNTDPKTCNPGPINYLHTPYDSTNEWIKPLGTGVDCWPSTPASFAWSGTCIALDPLEQWFTNTDNLNTFAHISHTFTHESLDNATYSDAVKEIQFNQAWFTATGIKSANKFSANSLIPPAITGLHNGDVIRAWTENGIGAGVGDNTRPVLLNTDNEYWPLITTMAGNGFDGFPVIPRWATNIYYNCDTPSCISNEYAAIAGAGSATFATILGLELNTNTGHLLSLRQDPFMFHQANLRVSDAASTTYVGGTSQQLSLFQIWVETIVAELTRLTNWPIISKGLDQIAQEFNNRMTRDRCKPAMTYNYDSTDTQIVSVTVSSAYASCAAPIPITLPGPVTSTSGATTEQIGNDPLTLWVTYSGKPLTYSLRTPISLA